MLFGERNVVGKENNLFSGVVGGMALLFSKLIFRIPVGGSRHPRDAQKSRGKHSWR
jgi:hypothetical protein